MIMFTLSFKQECFQSEVLENSLKRLALLGYDGVELSGDLSEADEAKKLLEKYNMKCFSINGNYTEKYDLSSISPKIRQDAKNYIRREIDLARMLAAKVVVVVPTYIGKLKPETSTLQEWDYVVAGLREVAEYAGEHDIVLVIEAVNRFESYLVNHLDTIADMIADVGSPALKMMADFFHMNIEEQNPAETLLKYRDQIYHVHIADNNRKAIGMGNLPAERLLNILNDRNRVLTMEWDHQKQDRHRRNSRTTDAAVYDDYAWTAIQLIKSLS